MLYDFNLFFEIPFRYMIYYIIIRKKSSWNFCYLAQKNFSMLSNIETSQKHSSNFPMFKEINNPSSNYISGKV